MAGVRAWHFGALAVLGMGSCAVPAFHGDDTPADGGAGAGAAAAGGGAAEAGSAGTTSGAGGVGNGGAGGGGDAGSGGTSDGGTAGSAGSGAEGGAGASGAGDGGSTAGASGSGAAGAGGAGSGDAGSGAAGVGGAGAGSAGTGGAGSGDAGSAGAGGAGSGGGGDGGAGDGGAGAGGAGDGGDAGDGGSAGSAGAGGAGSGGAGSGGAGGDSEPPTTPTNLLQDTTSTTSIRLVWTAATDNVQVVGYEVFLDGTFVTTVTAAEAYTFVGLGVGMTYTLGVRAYDAADNKSGIAVLDATTTDCTPACSGKQCGADSCGGSCGVCLSGFSCNAADQCQHPQLAGHWSFDESSGTSVLDRAGSINGVFFGASGSADNPQRVTGLIGGASGYGALSFNAFGKVNLGQDALGPVIDDAPGISVSAWLKRSGPKLGCPNASNADCRQQVLYSTATRSDGGFTLRVDENERLACMAASNQTDSFHSLLASRTMTASPSWDNIWIHAACVFDFATDALTLYVNGVKNAENLNPGFTSASAQDSATTGLLIDNIGGGATTGVDNRYFQGSIDQVKLFTKALTSTEISQVSSEGLPDVVAPTTPSGLGAEAKGTSLRLTWTAATDYVGVVAYDVYLDGALETTITGTTFKFNGLAPTTAYTLGVRARDAAGNASSIATLDTSTL